MADVAKTGETRTPTPRERFIKMAIDRADLDGAIDSTDLVEKQMGDILAATNEDELFDAMEFTGLKGLRDLDAGQIITLNGYRFVKGSSTYSGIGVFCVVDAVDANTGEEMVLDTGVERVMGFLRMVESGQAGVSFPIKVRIVKKETSAGEAVTFGRVKAKK